MTRVLVTYPIPDPGLPLLRERFDVAVHGEDPPAREEVVAEARGCAGMLTLLRDRVDDDLLAALPELRAVSNYAVGYDNIDVAAATRRGVLVTNTPDVLTDATADMAWALLLASARRVGEGERYLRTGSFTGWTPHLLLGADVAGATLGVIGYGRIGQAVARRGTGFGMRILYTARRDHQAPGVVAERVPLARLLAESDFVSVNVPLSPETHHLVDEAALRSMKPTAHLVNTARGPVVDEAALARALREGWIAGAGIDVFEREPEVHPDLLRQANAVLAPHLGSATVGARAAMSRVAATNLIQALGGERPANLVNPGAWR
ncbi:MAG TPA: D-glycerate dehydrogenase [Candidatus Dormibacteraeota bacterium]|nr:D-glycerate dehydrogenase [Candidatus Dormibacteraeota bacterium]